MSYCATAPGQPYHGAYHDDEYGFPIRGDAELLERLALEINQAGLSWLIVLKKRRAFHHAFDGFDVDAVASYDDDDRNRLRGDASIIRNRRKIDAVIENARRVRRLRAEHGSFAAWLDDHHPRSKASWLELFRATFVFVGPEVVGEFLMSTGYLPGAHEPSCPVYDRVLALDPPWARAGEPHALLHVEGGSNADQEAE